MASELEKYREIFRAAFRRDKFRCVYCDKDLLCSLDSFAGMHLDHLKPAKLSGPDLELFNRVSACSTCNSLKGSFDPIPGEEISDANFKVALESAKSFVSEKRKGSIPTSYYRDYQYWLEESGRAHDG